MWFRPRKKRFTAKPFDDTLLPPTRFLTVTEAVDEGMLLMEHAGRMAVKNSIMIGAITGTDSFSESHYRKVAKAALLRLAVEAEDAAERIQELERQLRAGITRTADAERYSSADIANMDHRLELSEELAKRLHSRSKDEPFLTELVDSARLDAWREVAATINHKLSEQHVVPDEDYEQQREERMRKLIDEDLAALLAV
ncbi:MAG: hypothetical protein ABIW81_02905 [Terrimesophilobacter sp.]